MGRGHLPAADLARVVGLAPVADLELAERLDLGSGAVRVFLGGGAAGRPDLDPVRLPAPACPSCSSRRVATTTYRPPCRARTPRATPEP